MAEQRSDNMTAEMEEEGLTILQKIEDMEVYALPLIERWSIAHQKLLGDDIAHCMNRMSQLASALTVAYYKKTSISELDEMNKASPVSHQSSLPPGIFKRKIFQE